MLTVIYSTKTGLALVILASQQNFLLKQRKVENLVVKLRLNSLENVNIQIMCEIDIEN